MRTQEAQALLAGVEHHERWLDGAEADALFTRALVEVPFTVGRVRVYGRDHDTPRRTAFLAESGTAYRYSGQTHVAEGLPPCIAPLLPRIASCAGVVCDSVLATHYRGGDDTVGWHADDEAELGPDPVLTILSLGAPRDLAFRPRFRKRGGTTATLPLHHGDLLIMKAGMQARWEHAVPRRAASGERIALAFHRLGGRS